MEMVKLKNGTEEAKANVASVMLSIERLLDVNAPYPMAFWKLVRVCQNDRYEPISVNVVELKRSALIDVDGNVHSTVKNIVLSAVEGERLEMTLVSPVAE